MLNFFAMSPHANEPVVMPKNDLFGNSDSTDNPYPSESVSPDHPLPEGPCCQPDTPTQEKEPILMQGTVETVENKEPGGPEPILLELKQLMLQMTKDFESKLKYDATKQGQIDKLYNETQEYKQGIIRKFQQSLVLAVIEQIDDASKQIAFFEKVEFSATNFTKLLRSYRDITNSLQDMLTEKFNVEHYHSEPLTKFDPKRQRSLKTVPTPDPNLNKLVTSSLRPGYVLEEGLIVRPELVEVYLFEGVNKPD
ncbi:MAG: nucleotide exchange factor GrpE [Thermoguttaceae bacterium]